MILQNVCRILPRAILKFRPKEFALRRPLYISSLCRADYKEGISVKDLLADEDIEDKEAEEYFYLRKHYVHVSDAQPQILLIQPFIRERGTPINDSQLMLEESIALVKTLEWKIVNTMLIGLNSTIAKELFKQGKMEEIKGMINGDQRISAVFISVYSLSFTQRLALEEKLAVPVIDKYGLVLQIFYQHARTMESQLQVALAEIPYIRHRLNTEYHQEKNSKHSKANLGESAFEVQNFALKRLESRIKRKIRKIGDQRQKLRDSKTRSRIPTVAVVGYTNCGKTSLIKALTGEQSLTPEDKLFATLDVTCHKGLLSDNLECLFIDTVGFISDIPTKLIASFSATLEDAVQADVIVHVRDLSHPDTINQNREVLSTFKKLKFQLNETNCLTVANKIDKVDISVIKSAKSEGLMPISATMNVGLDYLIKNIQQRIIEIRGLEKTVLKIGTGRDDILQWLRSNVTVVSFQVLEDNPNFSLITIIWSKEFKGKFNSLFIA